MYTHNFALQIPQELWERLLACCKRGKIAGFIREAIKEKLDKQQE